MQVTKREGGCEQPSSMPSWTREALRQAIRQVEAAGLSEPKPAVSIGIEPIDAALQGGLCRGALHEVATEREADLAAATGFALALASQSCPQPLQRMHALSPFASKPASAVMWIMEDMSLLESGAPYGPGLDDFGLAPERIVIVKVAHSRDALWAMEECLQSRGVDVVVGEVRRKNAVDAVAARRLSLAAIRGGGLALLLRTSPDLAPSAAMTRWIAGCAPTSGLAYERGAPRLLLRLMRNRRGSPGAWIVEWNRVERRFELASAGLESLAEPALDRPRRAASARGL